MGDMLVLEHSTQAPKVGAPTTVPKPQEWGLPPHHPGLKSGELTQHPGPKSSGDPPTSATQVAGTTGVHHHARLLFIFLVETGFCYVVQAGLELLGSTDLPASASQSAWIIRQETGTERKRAGGNKEDNGQKSTQKSSLIGISIHYSTQKIPGGFNDWDTGLVNILAGSYLATSY
ncbi:hypothetical protein AAY473_024401 [Plecturocebus cupreus]